MPNIETIFDEFVEDYLEETSERNIVIIASSKIDDYLFEILNIYLLPKLESPNRQDELLEGDRPLATFSSRIKMVFRLGIIDKSFYTILEKIREIRNASAHQIKFDLGKSPIRDKIQHLLGLIKERESYKGIHQRYFSGVSINRNEEIKCAYLAVCLILEAVKTKVNRIVENNEAVRITLR